VLSVAVVEFFGYPLDSKLWFLAGLLALAVWLVALLAVMGAVFVVFRRHGFRLAAVVSVIAVLGLGCIGRVDLDTGYPYVYFQSHRSQFATVAAFIDSVSVDRGETAEARLPEGQRELASGWMSVEQHPNGSRVAVLWMEHSSGIGYGYAYAPYAKAGQQVLSSPAVFAVTALDDGWWWVSNLNL
jgi:hypothetical protein